MRALTYTGQLSLSNVPVPVPTGDQVLLKVRLAGICNTDLEITRGYLSFNGIVGHEFVAEVVDGPSQWLGQRVVGEINVACGECDMCRQDIVSHCRNRATVGIRNHDGAFAEYLALSVQNLHRVPDSVSDEQAVFVEPLAAALQNLSLVHLRPNQNVVLIGAGKLGLLCALALRQTQARVRVLVRREKQAAIARAWGLIPVKFDEIEPNSAEVVVDCTGTAEGFSLALGLIRPRGTLILKSTYQGLPPADLSRLVVDEITVVGSRCGPFDAALRFLDSGAIDLSPMIEATYSLADGLAAFEHAFQPGVLKVMLKP
jgi:threonine dehydrogenase-like Zn-dependent dehydrogenase